MARAGVDVRPATPDDLPALIRLVSEMRETITRRPVRPVDNQDQLATERLQAAFDDPDTQVIVGVDAAGAVLGVAVLVAQGSASALSDARTVLMASTHVTRSARHRGVGRALVAAAAAWAESQGAETLEANVDPNRREDLRFYVRLGFAPLFVRRVVPLAALRRRLGQDTVAPPVATVGEALHTASRRGLRARLETARAVSERRRAH
jgi:GNAT superfamily N-acetyltransferase